MRSVSILIASACLCACQGSTDAPPLFRWGGTIQGHAGLSALSGSVVVASDLTASNVTISLSGAGAGATHPWHVHTGTCASGGPIHGSAGAYAPLLVGASGTASQVATLEVGLQPGQPYHVNVHASPQELATILACGDLAPR